MLYQTILSMILCCTKQPPPWFRPPPPPPGPHNICLLLCRYSSSRYTMQQLSVVHFVSEKNNPWFVVFLSFFSCVKILWAIFHLIFCPLTSYVRVEMNRLVFVYSGRFFSFDNVKKIRTFALRKIHFLNIIFAIAFMKSKFYHISRKCFQPISRVWQNGMQCIQAGWWRYLEFLPGNGSLWGTRNIFTR